MAEEGGTVEAQNPQADEFDRTLGGTPGEDTAPVDTPAPNGTPEFDASTWNVQTGDLNQVPEHLRPVAETFQRRAREMDSGISQKVEEVNRYERELKEARDRIASLEGQQAPEAQPQHVPGQSYAETAASMGVDNANSTEQSLRSLSTVTDIIDHHPLSKRYAALEAEVAALKEATGGVTEFVETSRDAAYNTEYATAVTNHGKETVDRVVEHYGDLRGRPSIADGTPLTVDTLVAQVTGKAAAEGAAVDAAAAEAQAGARSAAGGVTVTAGNLNPDGGDPTEAEVQDFFNKNFQ